MDISLYYIEEGQGKPLILLHGNGEDHTYFVHQIRYFSRMYRVIAIDTRGHGASPRGTAPFSIRQFAEDLLSFMDTNRQLKPDEKPCDFSVAYQSVVGEGTITELKTPEEKTAGLQVIMKHYSDRTDWTFPEAVLNRTCVFCLTVVELSGRAHG